MTHLIMLRLLEVGRLFRIPGSEDVWLKTNDAECRIGYMNLTKGAYRKPWQHGKFYDRDLRVSPVSFEEQERYDKMIRSLR